MRKMYRPIPADARPLALSLSTDATRLWMAYETREKTILERIHASGGARLQELEIPIADVNRIETTKRAGAVHVSHIASAHLYDDLGGLVPGKLHYSISRRKVFLVAPHRTRCYEIVSRAEGSTNLFLRGQRAAIRLTSQGLVIDSCDEYPQVRNFHLKEIETLEWPPGHEYVGWSPSLGLWALRRRENGQQVVVFDREEGAETELALEDLPASMSHFDLSAWRAAFFTHDAVVVRLRQESAERNKRTGQKSGPRAPISMPAMLEIDALGMRR